MPEPLATPESFNQELRDLLLAVRTADLSEVDLEPMAAQVRQLTAAVEPHVVSGPRMQAGLDVGDFFGTPLADRQEASQASAQGAAQGAGQAHDDGQCEGPGTSPAGWTDDEGDVGKGVSAKGCPKPLMAAKKCAPDGSHEVPAAEETGSSLGSGEVRMPPRRIASMQGIGSAATMLYSPYTGPLNPLSPPVRLELADGETGREVVGSARFRDTFNGPPNGVHGGVIAAVLDEVLGVACLAVDRGGFTGTLTVRYRRPTPLNQRVTIRGWVERTEGRKTFAKGTFHDGDILLAEAEGTFITA